MSNVKTLMYLLITWSLVHSSTSAATFGSFIGNAPNRLLEMIGRTLKMLSNSVQKLQEFDDVPITRKPTYRALPAFVNKPVQSVFKEYNPYYATAKHKFVKLSAAKGTTEETKPIEVIDQIDDEIMSQYLAKTVKPSKSHKEYQLLDYAGVRRMDKKVTTAVSPIANELNVTLKEKAIKKKWWEYLKKFRPTTRKIIKDLPKTALPIGTRAFIKHMMLTPKKWQTTSKKIAEATRTRKRVWKINRNKVSTTRKRMVTGQKWWEKMISIKKQKESSKERKLQDIIVSSTDSLLRKCLTYEPEYQEEVQTTTETFDGTTTTFVIRDTTTTTAQSEITGPTAQEVRSSDIENSAEVKYLEKALTSSGESLEEPVLLKYLPLSITNVARNSDIEESEYLGEVKTIGTENVDMTNSRYLEDVTTVSSSETTVDEENIFRTDSETVYERNTEEETNLLKYLTTLEWFERTTEKDVLKIKWWDDLIASERKPIYNIFNIDMNVHETKTQESEQVSDLNATLTEGETDEEDLTIDSKQAIEETLNWWENMTHQFPSRTIATETNSQIEYTTHKAETSLASKSKRQERVTKRNWWKYSKSQNLKRGIETNGQYFLTIPQDIATEKFDKIEEIKPQIMCNSKIPSNTYLEILNIFIAKVIASSCNWNKSLKTSTPPCETNRQLRQKLKRNYSGVSRSNAYSTKSRSTTKSKERNLKRSKNTTRQATKSRKPQTNGNLKSAHDKKAHVKIQLPVSNSSTSKLMIKAKNKVLHGFDSNVLYDGYFHTDHSYEGSYGD